MTSQAIEATPSEALSSARPEKTILVTGGAGFIGSNFVKYMYPRYPAYRLVVVDALTYAGNLDYFGSMRQNGRFQFHYGDIRNRDLMDRLIGDAHMVVHFAAESHVSRSIADTASCVSTDVVGTDTVASCVVKHKARIERFIHISTSEVYARFPQGRPRLCAVRRAALPDESSRALAERPRRRRGAPADRRSVR